MNSELDNLIEVLETLPSTTINFGSKQLEVVQITTGAIANIVDTLKKIRENINEG